MCLCVGLLAKDTKVLLLTQGESWRKKEGRKKERKAAAESKVGSCVKYWGKKEGERNCGRSRKWGKSVLEDGRGGGGRRLT